MQSKNVLSVLMHCFTIACLASILWFAIGYSLSLTAGGIGEETRDGLVEKVPFSYSTLALTLSVGIVRKRSGSCFK